MAGGPRDGSRGARQSGGLAFQLRPFIHLTSTFTLTNPGAGADNVFPTRNPTQHQSDAEAWKKNSKLGNFLILQKCKTEF